MTWQDEVLGVVRRVAGERRLTDARLDAFEIIALAVIALVEHMHSQDPIADFIRIWHQLWFE